MTKRMERVCRSRLQDASWDDIRPLLTRRALCLTGAGCSVTGGLPTADELILYLRHSHPNAYRKALAASAGEPGYEAVMKALPAADRYQLFQDWVARGHVNEAHAALASLIRERQVGFVFTTNFDDLLVRACALYGVHPATHDLGSLARVGDAGSKLFKPTYLREPSILFLHGRHNGFWQVHHDDDKAQVGCLRRVLGNARFRHRVWVIAGYSGDSDPLLGALRDGVATAEHVVWVNPSRPTDTTLTTLLQRSRAQVSWLPARADEFFARWASAGSRQWRRLPQREFEVTMRLLAQEEGDAALRYEREAKAANDRGERALRGQSGAASAQLHFAQALAMVDPTASTLACVRGLVDGEGDAFRWSFARYRAQGRCWREYARARLGDVRVKLALGFEPGEIEDVSQRIRHDHHLGRSSDLQLALAGVELARATAGKLMPKVAGAALDAVQQALRLGDKVGAAADAIKRARAALRSRSVEAARAAMLAAVDQAALALGR